MKDEYWRNDWTRRMAEIEFKRQALLRERVEHDAELGIYWCDICLEVQVHPEQGESTCLACLEVLNLGH
jgi:hypothetical protein